MFRRQPATENTCRKPLAVSAACSFAVFPLLISLSLARTTTAHVALILAALPVFTGLIGALVERRRPGGAWWAGVAIALSAGGVSRIAPAQFLQPVVSLLLAVLLFGETMTGPFVFSAAAIMVGVAIARRG